MQKAEFAFFGGPWHGQVKTIAQEETVIHAVYPPKIPVSSITGSSASGVCFPIEYATYRRRTVEGVTVFGRLHRLDVFIEASANSFDPYDSIAMLARAFVTCSLDHTAGLQFRVRDPWVAMHMVLSANEDDQTFARLSVWAAAELRQPWLHHVCTEMARARMRRSLRKHIGGKP